MCLSVDSRWCSLPWNLHNTAEHAQFSQLVLKPQAGLKTAKMIAEKKKQKNNFFLDNWTNKEEEEEVLLIS